MCGRFSLTSSSDEIREEFGVDVDASELPPRYNIAPQTPIAMIGRARDGAVRFGIMRWGLVPWWAKDASMGNRLINARAETLSTRPAFRDAFERRRCLILADGFYEWRRDGERPNARTKVPMRVQMADRRPFAFAGIWERWRDPNGEMVYSCAIVTTAPSEQLRAIHDRMPVILDRRDRETWLDPGASPGPLLALLGPSTEALDVYVVSSFVNSAANDGPECVELVSRAVQGADS